MKVAELEGTTLDLWVARAWFTEKLPPRERPIFAPDGMLFAPSASWAHGGPIIEREKISLYDPIEHDPMHESWGAAILYRDPADTPSNFWRSREADGPTPLIAAMRCFVASKFGQEVPND